MVNKARLDREGRRAGQGQEARGHQRHPRRVRPQRHAHRVRAEARRGRRRWCSTTSTSMTRAAVVVRRHDARHRRRAAASCSRSRTRSQHFVDHRRDVVTRRTLFELKEAKSRQEIVEGLVIAVDNIDRVIQIIRSSKTPDEAKEHLDGRAVQRPRGVPRVAPAGPRRRSPKRTEKGDYLLSASGRRRPSSTCGCSA